MKIKYLIQLFLLLILLGSCQNEKDTSNQSINNIVVNSPLAKLISRTTQNPTQDDNVLDNSSAISIQLPVTVTVDGNTVSVATPDDYQVVQDIKDEYSNDNDIVYFDYTNSITIKYKNFTTQVIHNATQLHDAIEACGEDDGFYEIDCISFNWPIAMNVYDSNNQVANTITIQSNQQLYNVIASLSNGTITSIVYPISMKDANGQNIVINSNVELETFIDSSIDSCTEPSTSNPTFQSILNSGSWYVYYFSEGENETYHYTGYNFTFINGGTTNVTKNAVTSSGTWSYYTSSSSGQNKLNLTFSDSNLHELVKDWIVTEYNPSIIHLKHLSGGGSEIHYLDLKKN
ncbi:hypothetical protein [Flavobacterium sp. N1994]|uniref:hypothetical protein n=1 Tax=Flavobacterium sp. N1994 TaxID=2986827 RepID=UPI002223CB92|nr:hypothetical protein [Flavobacterium sp. N1994]